MNIIKPADIEKESAKIVAQDIIDPSYSSLPLYELSDREFEILIYSLFKEKISKNDWPESFSDQISLMSGVAERGRDCVLYKNDKVSGIIQCKQYKNPYSRPNLLEELTKFLLYSILDEDLIPDIDDFIYFLCISSRLNEPADRLVNSFKKEIEKDISNKNVNRYIDNNIDRYISLSYLKEKPSYERVFALLRKIKIKSYTGIDIINLLYQNPKIKHIFFKSLDDMDVDELQNKLTKNILLGMKDEFGFNLLTDEDLKNIKIRIEDVDNIFRVNLLSSDFFGFHKDFFVYLFDNNKFEYFMKLISNLSIESNKLLIEFLNNEIQKEIIEKITTPLILKGKIHPYMGSFCNIYIFRRLMPEVSINDMSETNYRNFDKYYSMTKKKLLDPFQKIYLFLVKNFFQAISQI